MEWLQCTRDYNQLHNYKEYYKEYPHFTDLETESRVQVTVWTHLVGGKCGIWTQTSRLQSKRNITILPYGIHSIAFSLYQVFVEMFFALLSLQDAVTSTWFHFQKT